MREPSRSGPDGEPEESVETFRGEVGGSLERSNNNDKKSNGLSTAEEARGVAGGMVRKP